jgi:hypothetical protein
MSSQTAVAPRRRLVPPRLARRLRPWVGILQAAVAVAALVPCFRGHGRTVYWLVVFFAVPALRLALSSAYRGAVRAWLATRWRDLEKYPARGAIPWRAVLVFVVAPAAALLLSCDPTIMSGDSQPVMLQAVSLVRHGRWEVSEFVRCYKGSTYSPDGRLPYFLRQERGGVYSAYPSGMVTFAVPVAAAARALGANLDSTRVRDRLEKWTACWVACGCLALFFLLALHRVGPAPAWVMTALLAGGSVMYSSVGQALWQHGGVILGSLAALLLEFRQARRPSLPATLLQGAASALMVACRLSAGLFVLPFGAWVLLRSPRRAAWLAVAAAAAYSPWAAMYASIYGTPLGPSSGQLAADNFSADLLASLLGVLVSPGRGLLVYQPWLLLGAAALVPAVRRHFPDRERAAAPAGWRLFCAAVIAAHLALVSSWWCWWGGYCWGSRLAGDVVPLCALLVLRPLAALWSTAAGRRLVVGVGLLAVLTHVPAVYLHSDQWNLALGDPQDPAPLWDWAHPPFLCPFVAAPR